MRQLDEMTRWRLCSADPQTVEERSAGRRHSYHSNRVRVWLEEVVERVEETELESSELSLW